MKNRILLLLFTILSVFTFKANAQVNVPIGTGTGANGYTPFDGLYDYSWSSTIYLASEINLPTNNAGTINSATFTVAGYTANVVMANQRIFVRHIPVSTTSYSNVTYADPSLPGSGFTMVYSGSLLYTSNGPKTFTFQTPFVYNGTDNLEFMFENRDGSYSVDYPLFKFTATTGARSRYSYKDITFPVNCTGGNCNLYNAIPNIVLNITPCNITAGTTSVPNTALCSGQSTTLSVVGQTSASTLQWQVSYDNITFTNIPNENGTTYTTPNLISGAIYRVIATKNGCTAIGNSITLTVATNVNPGTPHAQNLFLCTGQSTILNVVGQATPSTIQWQSSTDNITFSNINNATSSSYTTPNLTQTTYYRVIITKNGCQGIGSVLTIAVTDVNPGSIVAQNPNICVGGSSVIDLTGQTNGATIQWQSSSDNITFTDILNATGSSYITPNLSQTTYYQAIISLNGCSKTSNIVTITTYPLTLGTTTASNIALCLGENTILSISGQTPSATIQWFSSTNNVNFSPINGATGSSYTTSNLTQTTYFKAGVTNVGCAATGNTVTVTVGNAVAGTTSALSLGICTGTSTILNLTGQTAFAFIQWQSSTDNITFSDIPLASGTTYTSYTTPNLTQTTYYRVVVTKNGCVKYGNVITITVSSSDAGTISATNMDICAGTNTTLDLTGQTSNGSIQWQSSSDNSTFSNINGETSINYTTPNLSQTTYYRVTVTNGGCVAAGNTITIVVNDVNEGITTALDANICIGTSTTLNVSGQTNGATLVWQSSVDNVTFTDIPGANQNSLNTGNLLQSMYYRVIVTIGGCVKTGNVILVNVNESLSGVASASNIAICTGTNTTLSLTGQTNGATIQWQSSSDNISFTDIPNANSSSYLAVGLMQATYFQAIITNNGCSSTSNVVIIAVSSPNLGTTSSASITVCEGSNTTLSISGQSGLIQWQSSTDNVNFYDIFGANSTNYTTQNLSQTTYYQVQLTSGGCILHGNVVTVQVSPIEKGTISTTGTSYCGGTIYTSVIISLTPNSSIQWQSSTDGINFTNIPGAISDTVTSPIMTANQTMYYRAIITFGLCTIFSDIIQL